MAKRVVNKSGKKTKNNGGNTMRRRGGAEDPLHKLKGMTGGADFDPSVLAKKMQGGKRKSKGGKSRRRSTTRH